jgi:hypothetical protein
LSRWVKGADNREKLKVAMGLVCYEIRQPKKAGRQTDQRIQRMKQQDAQKKQRDEAEEKIVAVNPAQSE